MASLKRKFSTIIEMTTITDFSTSDEKYFWMILDSGKNLSGKFWMLIHRPKSQKAIIWWKGL